MPPDQSWTHYRGTFSRSTLGRLKPRSSRPSPQINANAFGGAVVRMGAVLDASPSALVRFVLASRRSGRAVSSRGDGEAIGGGSGARRRGRHAEVVRGDEGGTRTRTTSSAPAGCSCRGTSPRRPTHRRMTFEYQAFGQAVRGWTRHRIAFHKTGNGRIMPGSSRSRFHPEGILRWSNAAILR